MTNITWDEINEELDKYVYPRRQPDDIDKWQIAEKYNLSDRQAFRVIDKMVKSGEWISLLVFDDQRTHLIRVIRKANG